MAPGRSTTSGLGVACQGERHPLVGGCRNPSNGGGGCGCVICANLCFGFPLCSIKSHVVHQVASYKSFSFFLQLFSEGFTCAVCATKNDTGVSLNEKGSDCFLNLLSDANRNIIISSNCSIVHSPNNKIHFGLIAHTTCAQQKDFFSAIQKLDPKTSAPKKTGRGGEGWSAPPNTTRVRLVDPHPHHSYQS